ncbi:flavin reductase [Clostridium polyendosporum]|uniref:Flavin reductase n=1 Tax=Clostridium polyendosporum TaxID=69208 RepID=A0A919VHM6_9CLOT|nr:NAD(P)H-dependent oxidoreductase [Clostridium polyendosporum]GIM30407.1 flavin reductase [Clostridium polyendosporum]
MKVTIIYGNNREGNTYNCVSVFKNQLREYNNIDYAEYFVPRDMPYFCSGCMNCICNGEDKCPHYKTMKPIIDDIMTSDGVILASPVYVMNVSGSMKALLDHLAKMWMPHRPNIEIFQKVGIAISTAAGAGIKEANKTLTNTFKFMGFKRYYSLGCRAIDLENRDIKTQKRIEKSAKRFYKALLHRKELKPKLFTKMFFRIMCSMIKDYDDYGRFALDKKYWRENGWLDGKKPF